MNLTDLENELYDVYIEILEISYEIDQLEDQNLIEEKLDEQRELWQEKENLHHEFMFNHKEMDLEFVLAVEEDVVTAAERSVGYKLIVNSSIDYQIDTLPNFPNTEQQRIIEHIKGSILVLAPAGTGKTSVLAARVDQAIHCGIDPKRILCLTFTNRAAQQMQDSLKACEQSKQLTVKTFHGLCAHILRQEAPQLDLSREFTIYDEEDSLDLLKEVSGISDDKRLNPLWRKICDCKDSISLDEISSLLERPLGFRVLFDERMTDKGFAIACQYQQELQRRQAIDFNDLLYYVRALLVCKSDTRKRWSNRFDFIQVDEVQDTNFSEYEVIKMLAERSGNLAMIGDLDQTIYEWRGSEPSKLKESFEKDFSPQIYNLVDNFRATKTLVNAASEFANCFLQRYTHSRPVQGCTAGTQIEIYEGDTEDNEGQWIAQKIQGLVLAHPDLAHHRVAVLTRTHKRAKVVCETLERNQIPCITVEQFEFFRRQEVKDLIAYLKLLSNPLDAGSLRRILLRDVEQVQPATVDQLVRTGNACGLRLTDLIQRQTLQKGDPFAMLLEAWTTGTIVVFDVETTGLCFSTDEVIQIAAYKLVNGEEIDRFEYYIKNTVQIGDSESIHDISAQQLAEEGHSAALVFENFIEFARDAVWVGHNVGFDIKMLRFHAQRLGIDIPQPIYADTCDISRRFVKDAQNYKLGTLAKIFDIDIEHAHNAMDDAKATMELLKCLMPLVPHGVTARRQLIRDYTPLFNKLSLDMERWKSALPFVRPQDLLCQILQESGLETYYEDKPDRITNLKKLAKFFCDRDPSTRNPETAMQELLELSACSKNIDMLATTEDLVPIITVHQSKGLEFDTVFIAGAVDGEFPDYRSVKGKKLEEEKRAFYVAMTRAKQRLYISSYKICNFGYRKTPSFFIDYIPTKYKSCSTQLLEIDNNFISQELADYYEYEDDMEAANNTSSKLFEDTYENNEETEADIEYIEEDKLSIQVSDPEKSISQPQGNDRTGMLVRGGLMMAGSFLLMGPAGPATLVALGLGAWNEHMKQEMDEHHRDEDF